MPGRKKPWRRGVVTFQHDQAAGGKLDAVVRCVRLEMALGGGKMEVLCR